MQWIVGTDKLSWKKKISETEQRKNATNEHIKCSVVNILSSKSPSSTFYFSQEQYKPHYTGGRFGLYCQKPHLQTGAPALAHRQDHVPWSGSLSMGLNFLNPWKRAAAFLLNAILGLWASLNHPKDSWPEPKVCQGGDLHETHTVEVCKLVFDSVSLHKCINIVINVVN